MHEYSVKFFIEYEDKTVEFLNINEENKKEWKKDIEATALSEYYKRKVIISEEND